jgi:hypothetical protein
MKTFPLVVLVASLTAATTFGLLKTGLAIGKVEAGLEYMITLDKLNTQIDQLAKKAKLYDNLSLALKFCDEQHKSKCSMHPLPTMPDADPNDLLGWCEKANGVECSWTVAPNNYDTSVVYPLSNVNYIKPRREEVNAAN